MPKKTVILGASTDPMRYSYLAAERLIQYGHPIVPVGIRKGEVFGNPIQNGREKIEPDVDTITLYVSPQNQPYWYEYILDTAPRRVIFNPGTENPSFQAFLEEKGIETIQACTLVMLATGQY